MSAPISYSIDDAPPLCDAGCGALATIGTDGTEVDAAGRKALPYLNVCEHHRNWPHSPDGQVFANGLDARGNSIAGHPDAYKKRAAFVAKRKGV